jgi:3-methyladenine DNA glycosylase/8-oxoguanine DNA glycosylase
MNTAMLTLSHATTLILHPLPPFHFDSSLHNPDHFPSTDNLWQPGIRWQTMLWQGVALGLKFENIGSLDQPEVHLGVWSAQALSREFLASLQAEIDFRYNFSLDLTDFYRRFNAHPQLGPVIRRWRGMRPLNACSLYEYLIISIVLQNATVRRSVNMLQALYDAYGSQLAYDGQVMSCFWLPQALDQVSEEELRRLKVGYRAKSILRVTEAFTHGGMDEFALRQQPLETLRQALLGLYGIGPASVGYLLSGVFHQWDDFNHISPWEQKIYSKLFFDRDPEDPVPVAQLLELFAGFAPWRGMAVHYLWEDLWWRRLNEPVEWLEKLIRL